MEFALGSEDIVRYVAAELAYVVGIERAKAKIGASEEVTPTPRGPL